MAGTFSPLRMTAATEEAAVEQALAIVGANREEASVEVVSKDAKGVTVRVSPRRDDEPAQEIARQAPVASLETAQPAQPAQPAQELAQDEAGADDETANEADDEAEFASEATAPETVSEAPRERPVLETRPLDPALQERAVAAAQGFLDRMGMDARAKAGEGGATDEAQRLNLEIEGEDVGILIGKHGQTLQAFQYLLNITLNNHADGEANPLRVSVDAGGYRSRRAGSLQQVARDAAARSKRDRRPVRMEPMPAYERRLVHMALQEDTSVATSSEGREPMRCVVVAPAGYVSQGGERSGGESRGGFSRGGNRGRGFGSSGGSGGGYRGAR